MIDQQMIIEEIKEQKRLIYHSPLPKKKQRVQSTKEPNGPVKVYTKEEIAFYEASRS